MTGEATVSVRYPLMKERAFFDFVRNLPARFRRQVAPQTHQIVIYTRHDCHLCEDAEQLVRHHGLTPTLIDIDNDPALRERFDCCVPVVEIDGKIRFRGRVNAVLLKRLLDNSPA